MKLNGTRPIGCMQDANFSILPLPQLSRSYDEKPLIYLKPFSHTSAH